MCQVRDQDRSMHHNYQPMVQIWVISLLSHEPMVEILALTLQGLQSHEAEAGDVELFGEQEEVV